MKRSPFAVLAGVLLLMASLQLILDPKTSGPVGPTALAQSSNMDLGDLSRLDRVASARYHESTETGSFWMRRGSVRFVRVGIGHRSKSNVEALTARIENTWCAEPPASSDFCRFEVFSEMLARSAMLHVVAVEAKAENDHLFELPVMLVGGDEFVRRKPRRLDSIPVVEGPIVRSPAFSPLANRALASFGQAASTLMDLAAKQVLLSIAATLDAGGSTLKDIASRLASTAGEDDDTSSDGERLVGRVNSERRIKPHASFVH